MKKFSIIEYNYYFKNPNKDTCKTCDKLTSQISAEENKSLESRNQMWLQSTKSTHDSHIKESDIARKTLKEDHKAPLEDKQKVTITFDRQKTLPTPKIPTGIGRDSYGCITWVYMHTSTKMTKCLCLCGMRGLCLEEPRKLHPV